jgi:hypothetical protein
MHSSQAQLPNGGKPAKAGIVFPQCSSATPFQAFYARGNSTSFPSSSCGVTTTRHTEPTGLQPDGMLSVTSAASKRRLASLLTRY